MDVLADYGYKVNPHGDHREQQFPCDLHGDGSDGKPSARAYPSSNSFFCFACARTRDAVQLCREKEGVDFWSAIRILEKRYGLPELPWLDDQDPVEVALPDVVRTLIQSDQTWGDLLARTHRQLVFLTKEQEKPMFEILRGWEAFDEAVFHHRENEDEEAGKQALWSLLHTLAPALSRT